MSEEETGAPSVLLVEDDEAHAELVRRSFEDHQVPGEIFHVRDGEAALDYLHRRGAYANPAASPRPRFVLLDLRLPRVDGFEVLRAIRSSEELHRLPVVVLTTSNAEQDIARAYDEQANSYLVKPFAFEQFLDVVSEVGGYWLTRNEVSEPDVD